MLLSIRTTPLPRFFCFRLRVLLCLTLLLTTGPSLAQAEVNYVRMGTYLQQHPEQVEITEQFANLVRQPGTPLTATQNKPVRIAVIYPALQTSDYWRRSVASFEARMKELNIRYELKPFYSRPSVDIKLQSKQLNQALNWQPDFLIFTLDALRHRRMIERILVRGKPKLILQNITTPLRQWQRHRPFMYVGFDHAAGTRQIADYMLKKNQFSGSYLMLYFSHGYVSAMRGDTFATEAAIHPAISQVASYYTDGNRKLSRDAVRRTLNEEKDLSFIFASSTDIALGAADALSEAGLKGKVMLNGWGGGAAELAALQHGALDVTVMRMNDDNGVAMAEAIRLDLQGLSEQVPHIYSGDIQLINRETPPEEIKALKARAFRYSEQ